MYTTINPCIQPWFRSGGLAITTSQMWEGVLGRQLWPIESYRAPVEQLDGQVVRKLWSENAHTTWTPETEPQIIHRLWVWGNMQTTGQHDENQLIHHLWQCYSPEAVEAYKAG